MKPSNLKYLFIAAGVALGVTAISVYSCEKQQFTPNTAEAVADDPTKFITEPGAICGEMIEKSLVDQRGKAIGQAIVYNDTKFFYVIATPLKGFLFDKAYMHITDLVDEMPVSTSGDIELEKYEYHILNRPTSTLRKFRIPLGEIGAHSIVSVAIDVVSSKIEARPNRLFTAYVDGRLLGNNGRMFAYERQNCLTDDAISDDPTKSSSMPAEFCGEKIAKVILKQDDTEIGKAFVLNDKNYFYVALFPYKNYLLGNAYMEVCDNMSDIPVDRGGNPQTSKFEHNITSRPFSAERIFRIPIADIETKSYVAVAVNVINTSTNQTKEFTAWIQGRFIGNSKNGRIFSYTRQNCLIEDAVVDVPAK